MSKTSQLLFVNPEDGGLDIVGEPIRSSTNALHTIAIYVSEFVGRVHVEASIANEPGENDWFPVIRHIDYPRLIADFSRETSVIGLTFKGNYMWFRIRVERSHLYPPVEYPASEFGLVDKVLLND